MAFDRVVALNVTDEEGYRRYREGMGPILSRHGGAFRYDFRVSETLRSESHHPINRVFALSCPDEESMRAFFQDPEYLAVRARHFDLAVKGVTVIAEFPR